ncbi:MAG: DMT family transporter [Candidatus Jidaibacter sp.]|nr:DMT family transporter [Candidatus Jidaibacter sp.]
MCFGVLNVITKALYQDFSPMQITFYRSFFCIILFSPFLLLLSKNSRKLKLNSLNLFKGAVDFMSIPTWALAISNMNIPEVVGISYITPILSCLFAIIFLKEKPSYQKFIAMAFGMTGAYIIIQPNSANLNIYVFVVLFTCTLWASSNVITKYLTSDAKQHPLAIMLVTNLIICSLATPLFILDHKILNFTQMLLCIGMACTAGVAYLCIAFACRLAYINTLMPFDYLRIICATLAAYLFLGQTIDITTVIGSLIIFISTLYLVKGHIKEAKKD